MLRKTDKVLGYIQGHLFPIGENQCPKNLKGEWQMLKFIAALLIMGFLAGCAGTPDVKVSYTKERCETGRGKTQVWLSMEPYSCDSLPTRTIKGKVVRFKYNVGSWIDDGDVNVFIKPY